MARHLWTKEEIELLKRDYPARGGPALAAELGLPTKKVANMAWRLGLAKERHDRTALDKFIREKHKLGWCDTEIAAAWREAHPDQAIDRTTLGDRRRKLGLPHNAYSAHRRTTRRSVGRQH